MEVIDFDKMMKEERVVITPPVSQETIDAQNKSLKRNLLLVLGLCVVAVPVYFFLRFGGGATDEGSRKYHVIIQEIFTGLQSSYPTFKSAVCSEKNATRKDCIAFTLVFYPVADPSTVGTVMDTVDKAFGVSEVDMVTLKGVMKQMIEVKHQYIRGRRAPLSVLILSTNMSRGGVTEEVKMECKEKGNDVECQTVR